MEDGKAGVMRRCRDQRGGGGGIEHDDWVGHGQHGGSD